MPLTPGQVAASRHPASYLRPRWRLRNCGQGPELWAGLFAPRGTPKNIISKLDTAAVSTLGDPTIRESLAEQGFEIPQRERQTAEALGAYQKAEIEKWWPIIKAANIKAE